MMTDARRGRLSARRKCEPVLKPTLLNHFRWLVREYQSLQVLSRWARDSMHNVKTVHVPSVWSSGAAAGSSCQRLEVTVVC